VKKVKITNLRDIFKQLPKNFILLVISSVENYISANLEILRVLLNEMKISGVYITINRPYASLCKILKQNGINIEKLYFIDCVSSLAGMPVEKTEKCRFLKGPSALTDIGIDLSELMEEIKKPCFLFLDSISTLLTYNSAEAVVSFSHLLITKMRLKGLMGVIITLEKESEPYKIITQFCDKVIEVK